MNRKQPSGTNIECPTLYMSLSIELKTAREERVGCAPNKIVGKRVQNIPHRLCLIPLVDGGTKRQLH